MRDGSVAGEGTYVAMLLAPGTAVTSPANGRVASSLFRSPDPSFPNDLVGVSIRVYDPKHCFDGLAITWHLYGDVALEPRLNDVSTGSILGRTSASGLTEPGGGNLLISASGPNAENEMRRLYPRAYLQDPFDLVFESTVGPRSFAGGTLFCDSR